MKIVFFTTMVSFLACFSNDAISAETTSNEILSGEFRAHVARSLSPDEPAPALTLEPALALAFPSKTTLSFLTSIEKPMNKYEGVTVPRVRGRVKQVLSDTDLAKFSTELSASALDVDRWSPEGPMVRTSLGLVADKKFFEDSLSLNFKAAPFYQFNSYRQTTSGKVKPEYGVGEVLTVEYKTGRTTLSADVSLSQYFTSLWKNTYATSQSVQYDFTDNWYVGVAHELLGSFVNESTGRYSSLDLFDSRQSRIGAYLGYMF